jgi:hypothetical protein
MVAKAVKKTSGPKKTTTTTTAKDTSKAKTSGPKTTVPKTTVPKTTVPKTTVPKTSAKKTKKVVETKAPVAAPVAAPVPASQPVQTAAVPDNTIVDSVVTDDVSFCEDFSVLLTQLKTVQTMLRDLTAHAAKLERRVAKESKLLQKKANGKVKRKQDPNRAPSGFSKPGPVSKELLTFLQAHNTTMTGDNLIARTDVTKAISDYCRNNGLQDQKDKRKLNADKTLIKLLRLKKGEELTFFNLQKFMKVHFPNKEGVYPTA